MAANGQEKLSSPTFEADGMDLERSLGKIDFRDSQFGYAMRALIAYGEAYAKMKEAAETQDKEAFKEAERINKLAEDCITLGIEDADRMIEELTEQRLDDEVAACTPQ